MNPLHLLLFWISSAALLLLPGALAARCVRPFWRRMTPGERILPAFLLSAGVLGITYLVSLALRPTLGFALGVWCLIVLILLAQNSRDLLRRRDRTAPPAPSSRADESASASSWPWALPIIVFGWLAMLWEGGSLGFIHDSLDFAAFVNRMLQTGQIDLTSGAFQDTAYLTPDPRRGAFHLGAALLCRVSHFSATEMWRYFPSFLVPVALWIFFAAFRRILQSTHVALVSLLFFVLATFFTGSHFINNLAYSSRLGWVYSWVGLWSVAFYLDLNRLEGRPATCRSGAARAALSLALVSAPILVGIHVLSAAQYLVSLAAMGWFWAFSRHTSRAEKRMLLLLPLGSLIAVAPFLAIKLKSTYSVASPLFDHPQGLLYLSANWQVLDPRIILARIGVLGYAALPLTMFLIPGFRASRDRSFLVGSVVVPILIVFNPLAVKCIESAHGHSLLYRMLLVIPYCQVLAWIVVWALKGLRARRSKYRRGVSLVLLGFVALLIANQLRGSIRATLRSGPVRDGWTESPALSSAIDFLDRDPTPSVVFSDPITSYILPAASHHYVMTSFGQHSSPADARALERIRDSRAALSVQLPLERTLALLRKYSSKYLLLNQSFTRFQSYYGAVIDPRIYAAQLSKFEQHPDLFERLYDHEGVVIFRICDPGPERFAEEAPRENPLCALAAAHARGRTREEVAQALHATPFRGAAVGGQELVACKMDSSRINLRGSAVEVSTYWRRTAEPLGLPVNAFLRMATEYPNKHFHSKYYGRFYRKYYERRQGISYRFGNSYEPLVTTYPVCLWEPGAIYEDRLRIVVPANAQPGTYRVRIQVSERPATPNLQLRDIFTLNDSFNGPVIGTLEIR